MLIVGGLTASIGVSAGAYTKNVTSKGKANVKQSQGQNKSFNEKNNIKTKLDALVKKGTLAQALEDRVIAYITKKQAANSAEMTKHKVTDMKGELTNGVLKLPSTTKFYMYNLVAQLKYLQKGTYTIDLEYRGVNASTGNEIKIK